LALLLPALPLVLLLHSGHLPQVAVAVSSRST
jgi:hypothetical protein